MSATTSTPRPVSIAGYEWSPASPDDIVPAGAITVTERVTQHLRSSDVDVYTDSNYIDPHDRGRTYGDLVNEYWRCYEGGFTGARIRFAKGNDFTWEIEIRDGYNHKLYYTKRTFRIEDID